MLEVVNSLPEESDTEQTAVIVFKQQPEGEEPQDEESAPELQHTEAHISRICYSEHTTKALWLLLLNNSYTQDK